MVNCLVSVMSYLSELGTKRRLARCAVANTALNRFDGELRWAKCVSTYDGDSASFALKLDGKLRVYKVRMYGYDSAEMKPPLKNTNREEEKAAAVRARDFLKERIEDRVCVVEFVKPSFDKYGRLLLNVCCKEQPDCCDFLRTKAQYKAKAVNINTLMVTEGHGVPYQGGTKTAYDINHLAQPIV